MNPALSSSQWDVVRYTAPLTRRLPRGEQEREVVSSHSDYESATKAAHRSNGPTNIAAGMRHTVEPTGWGSPERPESEWRTTQKWVGLRKQLES